MATIEVHNELLEKMRKQEENLLEISVKEIDRDKKFSLERELSNYRKAITELENATLKDIEASLKLQEPQLNEGINDLDDALQDVNNTVNILQAVNTVTSIVARIVSRIV